jgi:hypothetical protein
VPRIMQMRPQARAIPPLWTENPKRQDSVAERSEFEPSGPLIQHEKRSISSTFFSPPGKPIEASKGLRSHPGRASRRALPPSYRLPASLAQPPRQVWNSNCSLEHNLQDHKPPAFFNGVLGCEPAPASINGPDIATSSPFHTDVKHAGNTMPAHPKTLDFSARSEFLVGTPSLRRISRRRYLTPSTKPVCGELLIFGTNQQFARHTCISHSRRRTGLP